MTRSASLAAVEIAHIDWLRGDDGLLPAARAMLAPMARAATPEGRASLANDATADAIRERFNAAQAALSARGRSVPDGADVLGEVQDGVAQLLGLAVQRGQAAAEAAWSQLDQGLADQRARDAKMVGQVLLGEFGARVQAVFDHGLGQGRDDVVGAGGFHERMVSGKTKSVYTFSRLKSPKRKCHGPEYTRFGHHAWS